MNKKVILISIDGLRPDGLKACGNPYVSTLESICSYSYNASSMTPSVTFPCHFSMTHSVTPQRHGILSNTYVPQVRPVNGMFERASSLGKSCAILYGWEPLRDIASPAALRFATYVNAYAVESGDTTLTNEAIRLLDNHNIDLLFLYMVDTDEKGGHDNGWMSNEYLRRVSIAVDNVKRMIERYGDEYSVVIMADHGGHDRSHGTTMPEDMTVPLMIYGKGVKSGENLENVSLLDIAPTICDILGIGSDPEWEGRSLVSEATND